MSAGRQEETDLRVTPQACSIAVVYENVAARDVAIRHCDALAQKFMGDLEFDITWWRFGYLVDPDIAREASQAAVRADLILVSLDGDELPGDVKAWFERWLARREVAEGALALIRTATRADAVDAYFRLAARHANLEYLDHTGSGSGSTARPDRLREDQVSPDTTGLTHTPGRNYRSSGWGINE